MDNGNIIKFPGVFYGDLPAEHVLTNIAAEKPKHVFLIVWPADGSMPTYHSSTGDVPVILYRMAEFQHMLFSGRKFP
ncbi:MAG: hypothetical protein PSY14_06885 [bacterium]|nr:hypothetical protein [bacterium]